MASSIATKSGRVMIEALIDGERRPAVLADLAQGNAPHPGVGKDADPLFNGPQHTRAAAAADARDLHPHGGGPAPVRRL